MNSSETWCNVREFVSSDCFEPPLVIMEMSNLRILQLLANTATARRMRNLMYKYVCVAMLIL